MKPSLMLLCASGLFALPACEMQPTQPPFQDGTASLAGLGRPHVELCHASKGASGYQRITVADKAVPAHLGHGDGFVGDPVPGQPGMELDAACLPVPSRRVTTVTGSWNGTSYLFFGLFTVAATGPVDAEATVSGFTGPMRLALLGYNPQAQNSTCNTQWLPAVLPPGPTMDAPEITAHWGSVPPGTYCLNVVGTSPVPPFPPPYSWTVTIAYP
jgi:hypothetical protein